MWNSSAQQGTSTAYGWDATKVRNMAYGENGKLYLVYEHAGVKVVNAQTGAFISDLNKTDISGGTIALADVAYFDGKVVACNIAASTASPVKVYVWDTETSAPRVLLSTTNFGGVARLGDHIGLYGSWQSGTISFGSGSTIINYNITNGVVSTTPTTVNVTTNGSTPISYTSGFKVQRTASGYDINGKGGYFTRLNANGQRQNYLTQSHAHGTGFSTFAFQGVDYALAKTFVSTTNYVGGAMDLFDLSSAWSSSAVATYPSVGLGTAPNTYGTGDAIASVQSNYVEAWVLSTGQGVAYFKSPTSSNPDPDPDPDPDPEPDDPTKLKREMRAVWLSAMGLDWPTNKINSQPATQRVLQQNELKTYFDKLKAANINAVFFHIRPTADAMYPSTIVPWSHYLTSWSQDSRGTNPGYDPLRFAIDEAHKRGLELHGWMNPYRYTANATNHPSSDYIQQQHPEWILDFGSDGRILDPGIPAVRQHLADITQEVVQNYPDIDGIVWDDYFYISGISTQDNTSFKAYNPNGLTRANWRRDNVNKTVALVYNTIQAANPGIRFGISPRGFWGMKQSDANQYGVTLPSGLVGADNYNAIYADGMAWLSQGTIDYISPQLYWATATVGSTTTDYNVLAPWWQNVANKFNRHFYSSHGLYRMYETAHNWGTDEIGRQIQKNRDVNKTSPGSIFFSTRDFFNTSKSVNVYVKNNYFQDPILPPVVSWKAGSAQPARVSNVAVSGTTISWNNSLTDVSFVVFAVPKSVGAITIKDCDYMLQRVWTKTNSATLSDISSLRSTHNFAVAVVNRYGAMSIPRFESSLSSSAPTTEMSAAYTIFASQAGLHIQVGKPEQISIFNLSGVLVYQAFIETDALINLPKGVYVVKVGMKTVKVIR